MSKTQGNAWLKLERLLRNEAFRDPPGWSAQKTANAGISAEDLSLQGGWAADAVREFEDEVGHFNVRQTSFAVAKPGVAIAFHPANMNRMAVFYGDSWFYKAGPDDKLPPNVYQSVNGARLPTGMANGMIKLAMDRQNQKALPGATQEAYRDDLPSGSDTVEREPWAADAMRELEDMVGHQWVDQYVIKQIGPEILKASSPDDDTHVWYRGRWYVFGAPEWNSLPRAIRKNIHEAGIGSYPQNLSPRPGGNYGRMGSQSGAWSSGRLVLRQPEDHVPVDEEDDERLDTEYGLGTSSITQVPGAQTH